MPPQPHAGVSRTFERLDNALPALFVRPIVRVAIKHEVRKTARKKMLRDEFGGMRMVFEHSWESEVRPAKAEIHRRPFGAFDKLCEIVPCPEPGQDPVAFPTPRNDLFPG